MLEGGNILKTGLRARSFFFKGRLYAKLVLFLRLP